MKKIGLLLIMLFAFSVINLFGQSDNVEEPNVEPKGGKEIEIPLGDIKKLHDLAKNAPDIDTRIKAIQQLANLKKPESVQALIDILEEPYKNVYAYGDKQMQENWKVRVSAARAIRAYAGDKEVTRKVYMPLTKVMVYDPEERVKGECALTLGIIGRDADPDVKERIADELITKLNHTPVNKNLLALMLVKALGRLGHPKALVHLIAVTQKGYLRVVKEEAKKSIEMLQNS
ncbi:MAG TPA: HEAT repeat domain-containing protein [Spirochaetota bacterium]|nr:HEAT repeat domain-containing protein [Spirochaetota bacterium]HOM38341.1 HEAT repeat domain-containing protein [Spirochaetota bacterium]HPQ48441.1 HEAT repeat domain-containing protein [Spirochaetota bacterium]